jgi:hypothetical protein
MDLVKAMAPKTSRIGGDPAPDRAEAAAAEEGRLRSGLPSGEKRLFNFALGIVSGSFLGWASRTWR